MRFMSSAARAMPEPLRQAERHGCMSSAETPAERIACDLALDIHQGHIGPGELLPSVDRLMTLYDVPEASAAAALTRLSRAGIITGGASRGAVVQLQIAGMVYPALDIKAAAAMLSRAG